MARPIKNNADYFSHDKEMRNDPKIKYIRSKYGVAGYGLYSMFLEYLTGCENFEMKMGKMEKILLSGDFGVDVEFFERFIADATEVGLLKKDGEKIWSE